MGIREFLILVSLGVVCPPSRVNPYRWSAMYSWYSQRVLEGYNIGQLISEE